MMRNIFTLNIFTLNIHYKISSKYSFLCWTQDFAPSWQLKIPFFLLSLLMKAQSFQDNTVHSKNCEETLKINRPVTIFRCCYFLLSLMLSQFWEDLAVCVFLWDTCNQPPCKLSQKQTESCSWVSARLSRENIQFFHTLYLTKGAEHHCILLWPKKTSILYIELFFGGFVLFHFLLARKLLVSIFFLILLIFIIIMYTLPKLQTYFWAMLKIYILKRQNYSFLYIKTVFI